jgi:biopolymer transport protein ExbD
VLLALLALWISATPTPTHAVALILSSRCPVEWMAEKPVIHMVVVDSDNALYWDGQALAGRAALDTRMQTVGAKPRDEQAEVLIKPHGLADFGAVVAVMASAQRNMVRKMGVDGAQPFVSDWRCAAID